MDETLATCPHCAAPRVDGPECPRCGIFYAKAHAPPPAPIVEPVQEFADETDESLERQIRIFALPATLGLMKFVMAAGFLHMLARTFLTMWVHETGHAIAAWFCGFAAFPGPWFTPVADSRGPVTMLFLLAALSALAFFGWRKERKTWVVAASVLFALQLVCSFVLSARNAHALVYFAGDGGLFVLGTALMLTLYAPEESALRRNWLRWGFLVIGAAAFMDGLTTWWAAKGDYAEIPLGENEGQGLSDASHLVDEFGWGAHALVMRYLFLAAACGVVIAVSYLFGARSRSNRRAE